MTIDAPLDIPAHARRLFPNGVPWTRYVAVGDSIAEGLGDTVEGFPPGGWPRRLADGFEAVDAEFEFINLGERYLTARQVRETQLARAIELKPDLVTLLAGGNNMLAEHFAAERIGSELERMISELLDTGATVHTCTMWNGMNAPGVIAEEAKAMFGHRFYELNEAIRTVAARYIDDPGFVFDEMEDFEAGRDPANYSSDGQHLNSRGFAIMAAAVLDSLAAHLRATTPAAR